MNNTDNDGAFDTNEPTQPDVTNPGKDRLLDDRRNGRRRRVNAAIDDEATVLIREKLVTFLEDAVHLREENATSREQEIFAAETMLAKSDDYLTELQQANENLIITSIETLEFSEQLQSAKSKLENAKYTAEKANLTKSEFLSNMSHELRTPLNAILGFAQLLETGNPPLTDTQAVRLKQITKAGWYLLELINEILDFAVIESGKLSLVREPMLLSKVIRECQLMIEPQAQQRDIQLNFIPFDSTWFVYADRTRVKQVLINLLSNAIKYNREQGRVEVKCTASTPERLRISVIDSGMGLSPEQLARLFQPFNRLGQEYGSVEGTGIGLVVSKQLTELMGGAIGVKSTVGVGSEFWVELPRDVSANCNGFLCNNFSCEICIGLIRGATSPLADDDTLPVKLAPHIQGSPPQHTLLYVEDNPANLMLVEQIITGYSSIRMLSATNGELGIAVARTQLPDVILMDINLPSINGFEAMQILREDPATMHIPVMALSANALPNDIEKGLEAGFFRYLTKPIKINKFVNALHDALNFSEMGLINTNKTDQYDD